MNWLKQRDNCKFCHSFVLLDSPVLGHRNSVMPITRGLIFHHVKITQSTALKQERCDLSSILPALPNLWLVITSVFTIIKTESLDNAVLELWLA